MPELPAPDELALAGPEHRDPARVAGYDRKAGFDPAPELTMLRARGLGPSSVLVDLGAGAGALAVAAAAVCRSVIAVDVSPAMVDAIRSRAAAAGAHNLRVVRAGFLGYAHAGPPADVVCSRHALHYLPDMWKAVALRRVRDMLRPGGVLRLTDLAFSFDPAEAADVLSAWLDAAPDDPAVGWTRGELERHLRDEHSTFTWLLEPMLERAGFEILDASYGPQRVHAAYLCRRGT